MPTASGQQKVAAEDEEHQKGFRLGSVPVTGADVQHGVSQDGEECSGRAKAPFRETEDAGGYGKQPENIQQPDAPHGRAEDLHNGCVKIEDAGRLVVP